jgi:hypothetical protein
MPRSMPSATSRHSATPEGASCKLIAGNHRSSGKSSLCHETVMAIQYQVV